MSREDAEERIRALGGKAVASVSKATSYLVVGAEPGDAKVKAAAKHGTPVVDEAAFLKLLQ
jgi:DNA ligase (NAD+)